jgi:TRAP transporter TAXI family solute receptor
MIKLKRLFLVLLVFCISGMLFAEGQGETEEAKPKQFYTITTGTTGGSYYPIGVGLAQLFQDELGEKYGTTFSAQSSAGSVENVDLMQKDEAEIGFVQSNVVMWAYNGLQAYEGKPYKEFRLLAPMGQSTYHFMVKKEIESLSDFRGKKFVVGRSGSGTETSSRLLFQALGITYDDFKPEFLGQGEACDELRNGQVDGILVISSYPTAVISDLMATPSRRYKFLNISDQEAQAISKAEPWIVSTTIPAEVYINQPNAISTLRHMSFVVIRSDMPEDVAYDCAKTMWENMDALKAAQPVFNRFLLEHVDEDFDTHPVPIHPGARKYYQELGLIK